MTTRWHVCVNGYYGKASFYRERAAWWVFALEDAAFWLVCHTPCWRIPLIGRLKVTRDGEQFTVEDYYGDDLCNLAHHLVHPIWQWTHSKKKVNWVSLSLRTLIDAFGADGEPYWQEDWDRGTKMWRELGPPNSAHGTVLRDGN